MLSNEQILKITQYAIENKLDVKITPSVDNTTLRMRFAYEEDITLYYWDDGNSSVVSVDGINFDGDFKAFKENLKIWMIMGKLGDMLLKDNQMTDLYFDCGEQW